MKTLIVALALILPAICFAQDTPPRSGFADTLSKRQIGNISIMLPGNLTEKKVKNGEVFFDVNNGKRTVAVLIDDLPLEANLRNSVSSKYDFWKKTYYPGTDPALLMLSKAYKSGFQAIEKIEEVDLQDFRGFLTKGIRNTPKGHSYIFDYILFQKGDNQKQISLAIQSSNGYFLSDAECNYIVSTMKIVK